MCFDVDFILLVFVKFVEEVDDRCFFCIGGFDKCDGLFGCNCEVDVF